jgi:hypothetical protein
LTRVFLTCVESWKGRHFDGPRNTLSNIIVSPFALRLQAALREAKGAQGKLREGSALFVSKRYARCFAALSMKDGLFRRCDTDKSLPFRVPRYSLLFLFSLIVWLNSFENSIKEIAFRQGAFERMLHVNHRFGNGMDAILGNKVREFSGLDTVGRDVFALHCKLMGQAHRPRAMRSRGGDKDLKVNRLAEAGKPLFALRSQAGLAF